MTLTMIKSGQMLKVYTAPVLHVGHSQMFHRYYCDLEKTLSAFVTKAVEEFCS